MLALDEDEARDADCQHKELQNQLLATAGDYESQDVLMDVCDGKEKQVTEGEMLAKEEARQMAEASTKLVTASLQALRQGRTSETSGFQEQPEEQ